MSHEHEKIKLNENIGEIRRHLAPGEEILLMSATPEGYDWNSDNIVSVHRDNPLKLWTPQTIITGDIPIDEVGEVRSGTAFVGSIALFNDDLVRFLHRQRIRPLYTLSQPDEDGVVRKIGLEFVPAFKPLEKVDMLAHFPDLSTDHLEPTFQEIVELNQDPQDDDVSFVIVPNLV